MYIFYSTVYSPDVRLSWKCPTCLAQIIEPETAGKSRTLLIFDDLLCGYWTCEQQIKYTPLLLRKFSHVYQWTFFICQNEKISVRSQETESVNKRLCALKSGFKLPTNWQNYAMPLLCCNSPQQKRWRHVDFTRMHCGYQVRTPRKRWQEAKLMDWNLNTSEKITYCLLSVLQTMLICLFKRFQNAMHSGKIDIRHLFCYGELHIMTA